MSNSGSENWDAGTARAQAGTILNPGDDALVNGVVYGNGTWSSSRSTFYGAYAGDGSENWQEGADTILTSGSRLPMTAGKYIYSGKCAGYVWIFNTGDGGNGHSWRADMCSPSTSYYGGALLTKTFTVTG